MDYFLIVFVYFITIRKSEGILKALNEPELTKIYRSVLENYEERAIPIVNGEPLNVSFRMYIDNMVPRKKNFMQFSIDAFITVWWKDYRLKYNKTDNINITYLPFDYNFRSKIWTPNIYFAETKLGYKNEIPQPNVMIMLQPDGTTGFNFRLAIDAFCPMNFRFFPFDKQKCNLSIETYSYDANFINFQWKSLTRKKEMMVIGFNQVELNPSKRVLKYGTGAWDQLVVEFTLYRDATSYLINVFFPCFLIVSLSWINFWITHRSTPARVALGITTVLTIVTMTNGVRANSPSSGLFRSIDVYMLCCNLFVFGALTEAALIGMTAPNKKYANHGKVVNDGGSKGEGKSKRKNLAGFENNAFEHDPKKGKVTRKSKNNNNNNNNDNNSTIKNELNNGTMAPVEQPKPFNPLQIDIVKIGPIYFYKGDVHIIDRISRIVFPVSFIMFNVIFYLIHHFTEGTVI